jgi:hypothetical protein
VCTCGWAALYFLNGRHYFLLSRPEARRRGIALAVGLAIPFIIAVTAADLIQRFPIEINVPPPASPLFYPAMAYVVELLLHAEAPFWAVL